MRICGWPFFVRMMVASFDFLVININELFVWHIDTSQEFLNSKIGQTKTGVMMLKIQLWNHRNKLHVKIYSNTKLAF